MPPAAVAFIARSLDHLFGKGGKWHSMCTHRDHHHIERAMGKGKVMERHKKEDVVRLPASLYDQSVLL